MSDLSVFHRVDDLDDISGPKFFSLAVRLTAYTGVMQARVEAIRQEEEEGGSGRTTTSTQSSAGSGSGAVNADSPEMVNAVTTAKQWPNIFKITKVPRKDETEET